MTSDPTSTTDIASLRARIAEIAAERGLRCVARLTLVATTRHEWLDIANDLFFSSVHLATEAKRELAAAAQGAQFIALEQLPLAAQVLGVEGVR